MKRRLLAITTAMIITANSFIHIFGYSDDRILTDTIVNTYVGRIEATDMIRNAKFSDVPINHTARENIVRMTALNMIKGYGENYRPDDFVSNQEAIAFLLRAIGKEDEAQAEGIALKPTFPNSSAIRDLWSLGYLKLAMDEKILTKDQYDDVVYEANPVVPEPIDPNNPPTEEPEPPREIKFFRENPVNREQVADWIVKTLESVEKDIFNLDTTQQSIYKFSDWEAITPSMVSSVEKVAMNGIMVGLEDGTFNPKGEVTRAEMAQILASLDDVYNRLNGISKKTGTVGAIIDKKDTTTGVTRSQREIYIRTSDGKVDVMRYNTVENSSPQPQTEDVVVYSFGAIGGLDLLEEEDQIEYLVRDSDNTLLYVQKTSQPVKEEVTGILDNVNKDTNSITIRDGKGNKTTYRLIEGLIKNNINDKPYILMDNHERIISDLPIGSKLKLTLKNNIVTTLNYIGDPELVTEIRGMVTENNPQMGYITLIDNEGVEVTKNYYKNAIRVQKQQYYDVMDEIGYIDKVFPNFSYNPRDTFIEEVEAGDIVFITLDPLDNQYIKTASASTNYTMKYGKVLQSKPSSKHTSLLMEYENKQTEWIDVPNSTFVSKDTYPARLSDILAGDWIKVLVNEAIIAPGYTMQVAKEVAIEGSERFVSNVYKAQLLGINPAQQQIMLKNVETLGTTGWDDYQQVKNINIGNSSNVEYYYNGNRISLDFAVQRLKNNYETYVATQNAFGGEKALKISFRDSRDELLDEDNIIYSDGNGTIGLNNKLGIATDAGTIVVRHGRLTDGINIMVPDYAKISLNGQNQAAVVDIKDTPNTSGLIITRGRIKSINEGKTFQVQSMAILGGMNWAYTPIQRIFNIDYNTEYYNQDGWVDPKTFIDYTTESNMDKVFTIVTDGDRAVQIIDTPYPSKGIRGTIYAIEDDVVRIKDAYTYNEKTGAWSVISNKNTALNITVPKSYIIAKDNKSVGLSELKVGHQIRIMTDELKEKPTEEDEINGYIIFVEK